VEEEVLWRKKGWGGEMLGRRNVGKVMRVYIPRKELY
jgi:hypothetical protein